MKASRLAVLMSLAVGSVLLGEHSEQMSGWMKETDTANKALRAQEKKTGEETARSAERVSTIYGDMAAFWQKRNAADAVKWSEEGKAAATELASAAKAGDAEKAEAAYKALGGTCRSCHTTYREKLADGTYQIKEKTADPAKN